MGNTILNIEDLYVNYETQDEIVRAVNGLSLKVNKGEVLGLVGETGAGKTTTALSIMRLLPERTGKIKKGKIVFNGISLENIKEKEMASIRGDKISMVFQDPMTSLNPVKSIGYQISEVFYLHKDWEKDEIERKTDEILELVGIPADRKSEYPHQFSGGMKQRVVIAMALACEPELLITDEPTTALDVTIQAQVLKMMFELKKRLNTSMLLITHDLGVVAQNCDMLAIMYAGEIIEYGTISEVFESNNRHPYTDGLFNAIPKLEENSRRLTPIYGLMPNPVNLPSGCKFHPRCTKCMNVCKIEQPKNHYFGNHMIKCHLYE